MRRVPLMSHFSLSIVGILPVQIVPTICKLRQKAKDVTILRACLVRHRDEPAESHVASRGATASHCSAQSGEGHGDEACT